MKKSQEIQEKTIDYQETIEDGKETQETPVKLMVAALIASVCLQVFDPHIILFPENCQWN